MKLKIFVLAVIAYFSIAHSLNAQQLNIRNFYSDSTFNFGTAEIYFEMENYDYKTIVIDTLILANDDAYFTDTLFMPRAEVFYDTTFLQFSGNIPDTITSGTYNIVLKDTNDNIYSTNKTIQIGKIFKIEPQICIVSVSTEMGTENLYNMILWNDPEDLNPDSVFLYKEISMNNYEKIESAYIGDGRNYIFDYSSDPDQNSVKYKIAFGDSLGNESTQGWFAHKTIHLLMNLGVGGVINLMWEPYEGFNFTTYNIYRGSSMNDLTILTTISSSNQTYTDLTPPDGDLYYMVSVSSPDACELILSSGSDTVEFNATKSNFVKRTVTPVDVITSDINLSIKPNPAHDNLFISAGIATGEQLAVEILSMDGKCLVKQNIENASRLDISNIESGCYVVLVKTSKGTVSKQLIIQ